MKLVTTIFTFLLLVVTTTFAQVKPTKILITNVEIFNGKDQKTTKGNVLVENNIITKISTESNNTDRSDDTQVIDGQGKFLMPGLIDAHVHLLFESVPKMQAMVSDFAMLNLMAAKSAEKQLMRGFTTVRDLGGGSLSLAKAIDMGFATGPRVYSSGAFISQTGGHGDFGLPTDVPRKIGELSYVERNGMVAIADGADNVLMRTREQLRQGATQIKLMAGGGVSSDYDPLDVTQYTEAEFKAAVSAAENWGTYVTVHAYTPMAIKTAINAGVKCIDHGQLADDATAKLMAEKDIWWSLQPFLDDEEVTPFPAGSKNRIKQIEMTSGTDKAYALAKKYNVKTAWGTDVLFDSKIASKQGTKLSKMTRWYTPFEILKMATSTNAELLRMSKKRDPYQKGKLGEITEGAYADMLLVDGNPLENIKLVDDPEKNFLLIMKDGIIYKNILKK
ncbi:metal-dependent hydrolase family protein [Flavobacterium geliluteum]|uniref:Amidohydrolase family protein n=1 Tax=Flavobacterium geliluteum TaxID=2816120 RepID=A0A940XHL1_9FLAO|nr:amidohydrolase family protein [Flavobacterium geliluteum]MBP4139919.1 amidohydrolase family protein [Flavobacterium geliluteum]